MKTKEEGCKEEREEVKRAGMKRGRHRGKGEGEEKKRRKPMRRSLKDKN